MSYELFAEDISSSKAKLYKLALRYQNSIPKYKLLPFSRCRYFHDKKSVCIRSGIVEYALFHYSDYVIFVVTDCFDFSVKLKIKFSIKQAFELCILE